MRRKKPASPNEIARHVRIVIDRGGPAPYSTDAQQFFKEKIQTRGWATPELRHVARRVRKVLLREMSEQFLVEVADRLFRGAVIDNKSCAIFLLERSATGLGDAEFERFDAWIDRVRNWSEHDGLVHNVIGPMMAAKRRRAARVMRWAGSRNRWRRRAAAVALIRGIRQKTFFGLAERVARKLARDKDNMVQKGVGWMLREAAKANPAWAVRFLPRLKTSRFVLRTACETLEPRKRAEILMNHRGHRERRGK